MLKTVNNMLTIEVNITEIWDEEEAIFIPVTPGVYHFEHSLLSISKWEEKWCIPYLDDSTPKTVEQTYDYLRFMCFEKLDDVTVMVINTYYGEEISKYLEGKHTATWFNEENVRHKKSIVTSELVYYWMFSNQISKECETWNFNRLMTLIRVFSEKNGPQKKMSLKDRYAHQKALNAARRAKSGSRG